MEHDDIDRELEHSYDQGYEDGYEEGYAAGKEDAIKDLNQPPDKW